MDAEGARRELVGRIILVVEDNEVNLKLVRDVLEHHGYGVIAARDGEEGLAAARRHRPSLILMDLQLPKMDGFTATSAIRKDPLLATVPILAVTGFALPSDREKALAAGCNEVICKPIRIQNLLDLVRRLAGPAHCTP